MITQESLIILKKSLKLYLVEMSEAEKNVAEIQLLKSDESNVWREGVVRIHGISFHRIGAFPFLLVFVCERH